MKPILALFCLFSITTLAQPYPGTANLIDNDWRFHRGGAQQAESPEFNTDGWVSVDLPHDWSIEDLPGTQSPFSRDAISQVSGGYTTGGTGWYRKELPIPGPVTPLW